MTKVNHVADWAIQIPTVGAYPSLIHQSDSMGVGACFTNHEKKMTVDTSNTLQCSTSMLPAQGLAQKLLC